MRRRRPRCSPALVALAVILGCGGDDAGVSSAELASAPGSSGPVAIALAGPVEQLDPLLAGERAESFVARQVSEPLVTRLARPFGRSGRVPGLATSARPADGGTVWRLRLRSGVRFQDGSRFDAGAVLANAMRWQALAPSGSPAAGLVGADSPKPGLVRFILAEADLRFDRALASPQLGIVSPRAIRSDGSIAPLEPSGTGPFELREREFDRLLLARNTEWWGAKRNLGPGFEQVEVLLDSSGSDRVDALLGGDVKLADELSPPQARELRGEPLVVGLPGPDGTTLGLQRSVRGIEDGREIPSLAQAWLTELAG